MVTLPNVLSFLRIPLAFLFLEESTVLRSIAVLLAMLTDFLDGYLARRYHKTSQAGLILDPLTDKFFVLFVLGIFLQEKKLAYSEALCFFSRDLAVLVFAIYLFTSKQIYNYKFPSFWCGKIATTLQLACLLALTLQLAVPLFAYLSLTFLGIASLFELFTKWRFTANFRNS